MGEEQYTAALEKANRIRFARAGIKRDLKAQKRDIRELIAEIPEELETATLFEMLESMHRWGRIRSLRLLKNVHISETFKMGDLTDRQKHMLIDKLS